MLGLTLKAGCRGLICSRRHFPVPKLDVPRNQYGQVRRGDLWRSYGILYLHHTVAQLKTDDGDGALPALAKRVIATGKYFAKV